MSEISSTGKLKAIVEHAKAHHWVVPEGVADPLAAGEDELVNFNLYLALLLYPGFCESLAFNEAYYLIMKLGSLPFDVRLDYLYYTFVDQFDGSIALKVDDLLEHLKQTMPQDKSKRLRPWLRNTLVRNDYTMLKDGGEYLNNRIQMLLITSQTFKIFLEELTYRHMPHPVHINDGAFKMLRDAVLAATEQKTTGKKDEGEEE